ncbi:MAG: CvpA family protein [Pirellulales bacterium]|nr:CvpA family protein [Pirellulales bacterium]
MASSIHYYDIIMLVVLVGTLLFGVWKGMAWQAASLGSLVLSAVVALQFGDSLAPYISAEAPWNRYLAMFVLYLGTSLTIWVVFRLVSKAIDRVKLKEFDRQLGALFGLAKGVLLCVVITFFAVTLSETARQAVLKSYSGYAIAQLTRHAGPVLPEDVRAVIGKYIDELDHKLDPNTPPETPPPAETPEGDQPNLETMKTARQKVDRQLDQVQQQVENAGRVRQEVQKLGQEIKQVFEEKKQPQGRGEGGVKGKMTKDE